MTLSQLSQRTRFEAHRKSDGLLGCWPGGFVRYLTIREQLMFRMFGQEPTP